MKVKRTIYAEAIQWNKLGDHPLVESYDRSVHQPWLSEADTVSLGSTAIYDKENLKDELKRAERRKEFCGNCGKPNKIHGAFYGNELRCRSQKICPGFWFVKEQHKEDFVIYHPKKFKNAGWEEQ